MNKQTKLMIIENEILEAINILDEITTSDLQGIIKAQVRKAYQLGLDGGDKK